MEVETKFKPFEASLKQISASHRLPHLVTGIDETARAIFIAGLYTNEPKQMLVVEANPQKRNILLDDLTQLLGEDIVYEFPEEETLAIEYSISSFESRAQRVQILNKLQAGEALVVVTSVAGLRKRLTPLHLWQEQSLLLQVGESYEIDNLRERFVQLGYTNEGMVDAPGQFAIRGGIVDFYSLDLAQPVRLDFFDVELDSIRFYNPETQESTENIEQVALTPVSDVVFPIQQQQALLETLRKEAADAAKKVQDDATRESFRTGMDYQLAQLSAGEGLTYASAYLSYIDPEGTSILTYMQADAWLMVQEFHKIQQQEQQIIEENQYWLEQETARGLLLPKQGDGMKLSVHSLIRQAQQATVYFAVLQRGLGQMELAGIHHYPYRSMNQFYNQLPLIKTEIDQWLNQSNAVHIATSDAESARRTRKLLEEYEIQAREVADTLSYQPGQVTIGTQPLSKGFELTQDKWVVITEQELFNQRKAKRVHHQHLSNAERIKSYNELNVGDYVVHTSHGIGVYLGVETIEMKGIHRDMIAVEYADSSRIYIPVDQIQLLQKYVASEEKTPKLNKLGGTEWAKAKQKVQSTVEDIADQLIELYAKREQDKGFAFSPDTPEQAEFEEAFPYVETEDQLRSAAEIKADMEKERPMDRLLVGDVGYGKTEVAMRAIFKAVMDGKQVAFLVPTTILAQQHYNGLVERFQNWPFEIGMLSRFVTQAEQKENLRKLANGGLSIIVGTHRLLSKDVKFHDLGLLIVDEEQRFGVKHKERLKQLKSQVDVLTLTATPIPRTLHMSMIGVRDLSVIETPPNNRFPVQTYVMERNEPAIKSAIERELARGGQVFYLYNRVETIEQKAQEISDLVPEARVAFAHGRMNERELENVLMDFIEGEYDILVTTTIIETGVDIPNANTLFIDHAERMGLSTLYQLRGRVGRTNRVAYAYLMYDPMKQLSELSEKRLNAIREYTELGSGFKIAMRDLSIRGAGNLLGQQQSGFIDSVGYDLYTQMLHEAIRKRQGQAPEESAVKSAEIDINVQVDAYIPSEYIADERQKIQMYQAIQRIDSKEAYVQLQDQFIDRFGEFPDAVSDLLDISLIRYNGEQIGMTKMNQKRSEIEITFNEEATKRLQGPKVFEALQDVKLKAQIRLDQEVLVVSLSIVGLASDQWLGEIIRFQEAAKEIIEEEEHREAR